MIAQADNQTAETRETRVLIPGNEFDIGLQARLNSNGFLAVDLGMGADPVTFTEELIRSEQMRLGGRIMPDGTVRNGWRFRKEYLRDASAASGQPVFEPEWLDFQSRHVREPLYRMDLDTTPAELSHAQAVLDVPEGFRLARQDEYARPPVWRDDDGLIVLGLPFWSWSADARRKELRKWLVRKGKGRIAVWIEPNSLPAGLPSTFETAARCFAAGADVGEGVDSSETTCVVLASDTREQAAEFGSNRITPGDFGVLMAAICRFFNDALAVPVRKMHGITVIRSMLEEGHYGRIWFERKSRGLVETRADCLGWAKGETSDELLFGRWVTAIQQQRVILHSAELVRQLGQYIYDEHGRITMQALANVSTEERKRHGDRAVASALAWRGFLDLPLWKNEKDVDNAPPHSLNYRREQRGELAAQKSQKAWYER